LFLGKIIIKQTNSSANSFIDIVVIGRNEGEFLRKSLESVIEAGEYLQKAGYNRPRIIYVDGQSTDDSVAIATKKGIETYIVEGTPNPAKGRHLGFSKCHGKYIFFSDGDTILHKEWLVKAVQYLENNTDVAGVGGILDWEEWNNGKIIGKKSNYWNVRQNGEEVVDGVGGTFLYCSEVFNKVGGWNTTLSSSEEFELHLRIAYMGYKLVRIVVPMATHRDNKTNSSKAFLQRHIFNSSIFIPGMITRKVPKSFPVLKLLFYKYWLYLLHPIAVLCILIFIFLCFYTQPMNWIISGIITTIFLFVAHYFYKGKNLRRAIISVMTMNFFSLGWLVGLFVSWPGWDNDKI